MPQTKSQRMLFAFLTVLITVHAYVFYSLYVVNGSAIRLAAGTSSVLAAIRAQGGIYAAGRMLPIWAVVLLEFVLAYSLELAVGSPCSFRIACNAFPPESTQPRLFELAIICATVCIMCPAMSFLAAFLYYPYYAGFHLATLLADWLKLVCFNLPFAFFSQIFFIQPLVRCIFRALCCRRSIRVPAPAKKALAE